MPERVPRHRAIPPTQAKRPSACKRGYGRKWREVSKAFLHAHPLCLDCGRLAEVVDHNPPHKGDMQAFWDRRTWEPRCKVCHDKLQKYDGAFGRPQQERPKR